MSTRTTTTHGRAGFALPVAVFALVIVGVLVTSGFYMARQETRIGVASANAQSAFYLAERGIYDVLGTWDPADLAGVSAWTSFTRVDTLSDGHWEVTITPMTQRLYFLDAQGTSTVGGALWSGATRRVGMIARVIIPVLNPPAALTTQGALKIGGSSMVQGNDTIPAGWGALCDSTALTDKPGIMLDDSANISYSGNSYEIDGSPAVTSDPNISTATLLDFGELDWNELVAMAQKRYNYTTTITNTVPDSVLSGSDWDCRESTQSNWGDPLNPGAVCSNYFPIIYAAQDLSINSSGVGQGILLIEGDLAVQGGFTFYGPVIVRGELKTAGTGGHFNGGVIAANVDLSTSTVLGNALVSYSSCAVERALLYNSQLAKARPLTNRSWVDLSSITYN